MTPPPPPPPPPSPSPSRVKGLRPSKIPGVDSVDVLRVVEPVVTDTFNRLRGVVPELPELPSWAPDRWSRALVDRLVAGSPRVRREAAEGVVGLFDGRPVEWWASPLGVAVACGLAAGDRVELPPVNLRQVAEIVGCHLNWVQRLAAQGRLEMVERPSGSDVRGRQKFVSLWQVVLWVAATRGCAGGVKP